MSSDPQTAKFVISKYTETSIDRRRYFVIRNTFSLTCLLTNVHVHTSVKLLILTYAYVENRRWAIALQIS